jgi:DNA-directed RNA polymerase specialized sigma24 family protein
MDAPDSPGERSQPSPVAPQAEQLGSPRGAEARRAVEALYPKMKQFFQVRRLPEEIAEDLALQVFRRVWQRAEQIDDVSSYVQTALQNALKEHFRKSKRYRDVLSLDTPTPGGTVADLLADGSPSPEAQAMGHAAITQLEQALSPEQFDLLTRIARGDRIADIAAATGTDRNILYQRLHRARRRAIEVMKNFLEDM